MNQQLLLTLLDASIRAAVLAALVAAIIAIARVRAGAVRHGLWTATLTAMLAMPMLPRVLPAVVVTMPFPIPPALQTYAFDAESPVVAPLAGTSLSSAATMPIASAAAQAPVSPARSAPSTSPVVRRWPLILLATY